MQYNKMRELQGDLIVIIIFIGEIYMKITYKRLWKLLIDRDIKKKELAKKAGISTTSIAKLGKNENVNTDILIKICKALECDLPDIMELIEEDN